MQSNSNKKVSNIKRVLYIEKAKELGNHLWVSCQKFLTGTRRKTQNTSVSVYALPYEMVYTDVITQCYLNPLLTSR